MDTDTTGNRVSTYVLWGARSMVSDETLLALKGQGLTARSIGARVGMTRDQVLGRLYRYKERGGPVQPRVKQNKATDPATRAIIDRVDRSGLDKETISEGSGIAPSTLDSWRWMGVRGTPFLIACVNEYLDDHTC
jgi:hypothetical protein